MPEEIICGKGAARADDGAGNDISRRRAWWGWRWGAAVRGDDVGGNGEERRVAREGGGPRILIPFS